MIRSIGSTDEAYYGVSDERWSGKAFVHIDNERYQMGR